MPGDGRGGDAIMSLCSSARWLSVEGILGHNTA